MSRSIFKLSAQKIAFIYVIIAAIWILVTDRIASYFLGDINSFILYQTIKGLAFVIITGGLVYILIKRHNRRLYRESELLKQAEKIAGMGSWNYDTKTGSTEWSDEMYRIFDWDENKQPPSFNQLLSKLNDESRKKLEDAVQQQITDKEPYTVDLELETAGNNKKFIQSSAKALTDSFGDVYRIIGTAMDITERKLIELELRRSRSIYRQAERIARLGYWQRNLDTNEIEWSPLVYEIVGVDADTFDLTYQAFLDMVADEDRDKLIRYQGKAIDNKEDMHIHYRLEKPDGSIIHLLERGEVLKNEFTDDRLFAGIIMDVTDLHQTEEQLKQSLTEKNILIQEIHHRVKNNLAVISSMLELQEDQLSSEMAKKALQISRLRIHSIAKIHEKLYENESLAHIKMDEYITELSQIVGAQYQHIRSDVNIEIDAEPIIFNINQAIPCGLILNELLNNAYQHAFDNADAGLITIGLTTKEENQLTLIVADNGKGLEDEQNIEEPKSLGMTLIKSLVEQLHGTLAIDRKEGTSITIEFTREEVPPGLSE